jgi:5-methylcytosine-specific restriction endonuclease McrA
MSKLFWQAFNESNGRCVYCLKDLLSSFEEFSQAQEDHLVPMRHDGPESADNIVIACAVCNALKHHHAPASGDYSADKRSEYIEAARRIINEQRQKRFDDYNWWVSRFATRFVPIEQQ